jgi:hypothetical protein
MRVSLCCLAAPCTLFTAATATLDLLQATLAEAEAADGERKALGEQLAAATKAVKELEKEVGGWMAGAGWFGWESGAEAEAAA